MLGRTDQVFNKRIKGYNRRKRKIYKHGGGKTESKRNHCCVKRKTIPWGNLENKTTQKSVVFTGYQITFIPSDIAIYCDFLVED